MSSLCLLEKLETGSGKKIKLKINDNRMTMLSVKWEPEYTTVSLHRMFLKAPEGVVLSIGKYIGRKKPSIDPTVKAYIENSLRKLDYSPRLDRTKLSTQGSNFNLQTIFNRLNRKYFGGKLDLSITWFGIKKPKSGSRVALGLYHDSLRLIKIHRLLDNRRFPDFVVEYVIYHEMVHFVRPPYVDSNGITKIHHKAFKAKEEEYEYFHQATQWIEKHQLVFFNSTF